MNNQTTIEKLKQMRLNAMAQMHYSNMQNNINQDYTIDEYVSLLVDREWEDKQNRKIKNLIKNAHFRFAATVKDLDYTANR